MPSEFEKAMDYTLIGLKNTYCFLDKISIVRKGLEEEPEQYVLNCLKHFDEENLRISHPKCQFSKLQNDWLYYHVSQSGILPLQSKTSAILTLEAPKTLKKLRSLLGSVHYSIILFTILNKLAMHYIVY